MGESDSSQNDIAIVGMALRVPGAATADAFWENLKNGVESIVRLDEATLLAAGESPETLRNPAYVPACGPLADMKMFDGEFFGFSPKESAILDPQHRHFTELCWEALENAGHTPDKFDGQIGVFGGCGMGSYFYFNVCSNRELVESVGLFLLRHTGNDKDFLSTRVAYVLDLRGPAVNVQTACSTSLVATHLACQSLLSGESDLALAGGSTILFPHMRGYLYAEGEVLSPDGHCHAFDHRAQGTVLSSGAGVVALRRLEDAIADGDPIYAVIKGSAINNDGGQKVGYLAPSVDGQAAAMAEAYSVAGVDPATIGYVECHGTGTYMGDPIEISALTQAFRQSTSGTGFCRIGSVKTNIGHLDTAAGVASLIKASLALQNEAIPASLGYESPNPEIGFERTPFVVNAELHPWKRGAKPRRAAVNSLGVGGTNAHVVIEEAPLRKPGSRSKRAHQLLRLSARNNKSLDANARALASHLRANPGLDLADVAYTLEVGRSDMARRRVLVARDLPEAIALLEGSEPARVHGHGVSDAKASVVFMFSGAASQYPAMAVGLHASEPVFRQHFDRGLAALEKRTGRGYREIVFPNESQREAAAEAMQDVSIQLPIIFVLEHALAQLWMSWGVKPDLMIGHSLGENTAACLAGVFSFEEALDLVILRGRLTQRAEAGTMTSVQLPAADLVPLLAGECDLASVNAPELCVASGTFEAIEALEKRLAEKEIEFRRLPISRAGHSRLFDPILKEFGDFLRSLKLRPPQIPFISNRTGRPIRDEEAMDPEYWVGHLRNTVLFGDGIDTVLSTPGRILIEVGPGQTLCSFARQHPASRQGANVIPSLRHRDDPVGDDACFLAGLGRVWASGLELDLSRLREGETRRRLPLPAYQWSHQPYFIEATPLAARDEGRGQLERLEDVADWGRRPTWVPVPFERPVERKDETWLLLMDDAGVGRRLHERLAARGERVIRVYEGDAYRKRSADEYTVAPELGRTGYDALIKDLVANGQTPSQIVHLWLTTDAERFRPGSSFLHQNIQDGFYSLYFLAQSLAEESLPRPVQISLVSNGMARVDDGDRVLHPEKAIALGPVKVIPRELTQVACRSIDLRLPARPEGLFGQLSSALRERGPAGRTVALDRVAEHLLRELDSPAMNEIVAHREGQRFVRRFDRESLAPAPADALPLRPGGTYLVTGGLGGLALNLAGRLARDLRPQLILLGRTAMPARDAWDEWLRSRGGDDPTGRKIEAVRALEAAGARVEIVAADVTSFEQMNAVARDLRDRLGPVHGIFHVAGIVKDELIQLKVDSEIEDVFGPKVYGTLVLDSLLETFGSELFVLFSSTSAIAAPPGQIDYAGANAFLDAYAWSRAGSPVRTVSVNWGIWNGIGMVAETFGRGRATTAREAALPTGPMRHPLFDERIRDSHGRTAFQKSYSPQRDWVLDEHRTRQGQPLLPGTAYPELARTALAEYGEEGPFEIRDLYFIRPVHLPDGERRDVRVYLHPSESGYRFEVRTGCRVEGRMGFELNIQASLDLGRFEPPAKLDLAAIDARCQVVRGSYDAAGHRSGQEEHVAFGPRWRVLRQVVWGEGEALAQLELPGAFAGDLEQFGLHPALLDYATGYAMDLIEGYRPDQGLWIPVSYRRMAVFGKLPKRIYSWVRNHGTNRATSDFASFDVTITDAEGRVLLEIEDYTIKRLVEAPDFALRSQPVRADVEFEAAISGGDDKDLSPAERQLKRNFERGIRPDEGAEALMRVLARPELSQVVVSSLDLAGLIEQTDKLAAQAAGGSGTKFDRPELDSEFVEARDDIERTLVGMWEELLGVKGLGVRDNFFDLGGHSLIAVRLFTMIKKAYKADFPISVLFEAPTIEGCAALVREEIGTGADAASAGSAADSSAAAARTARRSRHKFLVAMDPNRGQGGTGSPFFLVAGMFGNVLNLRHLATLVGADRPFYGLQARGLYGDEPPHESFEEMASAYIEEMRSIQPEGPYFVGGFSGGGLTAFEIAHQLRAAGQQVGLLLLLDSRLPQTPRLTALDRTKVQWQRLRRQGLGYLGEWARKRAKWQLEQIQARLGAASEPLRGEDQFHNEAIERAFRAALPRYRMRKYPGPVVLFRPKPDLAYRLGPGRHLDSAKEWVWEDNGFRPWADSLEIHEMPGNHDSMVLEPNVRVMADRLRACLAEAEARVGAARRED